MQQEGTHDGRDGGRGAEASLVSEVMEERGAAL